MNTVIIISPHPDDLEIGMGGTAAKLVSAGHDLISVVVTDGRRSTNVNSLTGDELARLRENEVRASTEILGINKLKVLGLKDVVSEENIMLLDSRFRTILEKTSPAEIYMPHPKMDKHNTHRRVSGVLVDILSDVKAVKGISPVCWCYEVWTPFGQYDRIEDITGYTDLKARAVESHKSQVAYKDYTEGILGLNRYRAVFNETSGFTDMKYAEVFINYKY